MVQLEIIQASQYCRPYHRESSPWSEIQARYLVALALLGEIDGKNILDFGGGDGAFSTKLADKGANVNLYDIDVRAMNYARADTRIQILKNLSELQKPLDTVVALEVFEHIRDDKAVLIDLSKRLELGGHIIVSVPSANISVSSKHEDHYSFDGKGRKIKDRLKASGLTLEEIYFAKYPVIDFRKIPGPGYRPKKLLTQLLNYGLTTVFNDGIMFGGSTPKHEEQSTHIFFKAVKK